MRGSDRVASGHGPAQVPQAVDEHLADGLRVERLRKDDGRPLLLYSWTPSSATERSGDGNPDAGGVGVGTPG